MMFADHSRRKCGLRSGAVSAKRPRICTGEGYAPRPRRVEPRRHVWSDQAMASRRSLVPVLLLALATSGCFFNKGADARDAAEMFATALQKGDVSKIPFTDATAPKQYAAVMKTLDHPVKVAVDQVTRSGDSANVRLNWSVDLGGNTWKHQTSA